MDTTWTASDAPQCATPCADCGAPAGHLCIGPTGIPCNPKFGHTWRMQQGFLTAAPDSAEAHGIRAVRATQAAPWSRGSIHGITTYVHDTTRAVIVAGIDGGWTLNRDVTTDGDLENYPTLGAAFAAHAAPQES